MRWLISAVAITLFLSACGQNPLMKQIDAGEKMWQERGVASYRIEVLAVRGTWHAQKHRIVVKDGKVVDASALCIPAPAELGKCKVEPFNAEDFTVPGLFALARTEVQKREKEGQRIQITFDPDYGFPRVIAFDSLPGVTDGGGAWQVREFEVLK